MSTATSSDLPIPHFYTSLEEAIEAEKTLGLTKGYCLKILRTHYKGNRIGGTIKRRTLECVHGDVHQSQAHTRNSSTLRQQCPFQIWINLGNKDGDRRSSMITREEHNHEPVENVAAYAPARKLSEAEIESVNNLSSIGVKPRIILNALRQQNPSNISTSRDIHNIKMSQKRKILNGRTEIERLLDTLINKNIEHAILRDSSENLTCLFIRPNTVSNIIKKYSASKVFLLDSTYKTNRYRMPLLHGVSITATNESFTLFFCFLRFETQEFYEWAMHEVRKFLVGQNVELNGAIFVTDRELALISAISIVMPETNQIFCQWHINKNLLAKHRASFNSEDAWKEFMMLWQSLVNSPTTTEYNVRLNLLREQVPETVATYLLTTWLSHKERTVLAWTKILNILETLQLRGLKDLMPQLRNGCKYLLVIC